LREPARRAIKGEVVQDTTTCLVGESGEHREYLVNAAPLMSEQASSNTPQSISGAVVVWHDITESRKLLEEQRAFAESETRRALLQLVLDELPSSTYLVRGKDARLVLANRATATVWRATWERGQPMNVFLKKNNIRIFGNDGLSLPFEQFAAIRAVRQGEIVYQHQEVIRHADGTSLPVLVNAVALDPRMLRLPDEMSDLTSQAEEPAALVVYQDVTALKEAERLKDEFIGIAAHELRTPLAVLKGYAQMLLIQPKRGKGQKLVDWQEEALQNIDQATQRLTELTEDLLDVTRLQAGRLALHLAPTDLVALAERVIKRLRLISNHHTLNLHANVEHLVVDIDPQRVEQVLSNLLNNAVKYSPEGGNVDIFIQAEDDGDKVLVRVCDQGIGIPVSQQAQIFSRFMRADNAREQGIGGTGLGLYLCRELVERQCGHIWFDSVEGQGSTFYVSLPLHQDTYSEEDMILPA
ncbi:MAG TPA: HAMP domain-containing sensor histidine kinase, partial [Ktedonobacteraceae bacterium]